MTSPSLPPQMRAWTHTRRGPPQDVLQFTTLPTPDPSTLLPDEVLVQISYAGIFAGTAALMGLMPHFTLNPWIPCHDFSGTVLATGSAVTHVKPGEAVFGTPNPKKYFSGKYNGVLAEYAVLPAGAVLRKPDNISMASAGGVGGNGCSAIQFCELVRLRQGSKVLVTGASGSTGSLTAQIARAVVGSEGKVVATCSAANEELVRGLGVDEVIDYKKHPLLHEYLTEHHSSKQFDAIIDMVGGDISLYSHSPSYLKENGVFLFAGNISIVHGSPTFFNMLSFVVGSALRSRWPVRLGGVPRESLFHSGNIDQNYLQRLSKLMEDGKVTGLVDSEWPMEDAIKAFERVKTARARGKVVVSVRED